MKVLDYIKQSFRDFGITLSDANILTILKPSGVVGEDDVENLNNSQFRDVSVGMVKFIPTLLLRGSSKSVSETGTPNHNLGTFRVSKLLFPDVQTVRIEG